MNDGRNYYQKYDKFQPPEKMLAKNSRVNSKDSIVEEFNDNLVGECFLGFSKLLQSELRRYEKRDSTILSNRLTKMSNRVSVMVVPIGKGGLKKGGEASKHGAGGGDMLEMEFFEPSISKQRHIIKEKKSFEEQLWLMGKVLGSVRGTFTFSNMPML